MYLGRAGVSTQDAESLVWISLPGRIHIWRGNGPMSSLTAPYADDLAVNIGWGKL